MRISHFPVFASLLAVAALGTFQVVAAEKPAAQPQAAASKQAVPSEGKVVSMADASIYTYVELEAANGKRFWVAGPTTKVKVGDKVRFAESMVAENFTSKTLNRTFDRIIFASGLSVMK